MELQRTAFLVYVSYILNMILERFDLIVYVQWVCEL
jgi:hypothetical protein